MNYDQPKSGDAQAIIEFAAKRLDPKIVTVTWDEGGEKIVAPAFINATGQIHGLESVLSPYRSRPLRKRT